MPEQSIRFTVTNGLKRAATWKCWTASGGRSDIYLACRELKGAIKASLHESGNWHLAYSREFLDKNLDISPNESAHRYIHRWSRQPQIAPGVTLAFRIITPHSGINVPFYDSQYENIVRIPEPPDNKAIEIDIIITAPNTLVSSWPGKNSMNTELAGSMSLDSGEKVWIVYRVIDMPAIKPVHGRPKYFKNKGEDDLVRAENLRLLMFGNEKDGSRVIYDCTATFEK